MVRPQERLRSITGGHDTNRGSVTPPSCRSATTGVQLGRVCSERTSLPVPDDWIAGSDLRGGSPWRLAARATSAREQTCCSCLASKEIEADIDNGDARNGAKLAELSRCQRFERSITTIAIKRGRMRRRSCQRRASGPLPRRPRKQRERRLWERRILPRMKRLHQAPTRRSKQWRR